MSTTTNTGKHACKSPAKTGKPSNPKSCFTKSPLKGSVASPPKKICNLFFAEELTEGFMVGWVAKGNKPEEAAFLKHDLDILHQDQSLQDSLHINDIIPQKGADGRTPKKTSPGQPYNYVQFLSVVDNEETNTKQARKAWAETIIAQLNSNASLYKFLKLTQFGGDKTKHPHCPLSSRLLDENVINIMKAMYPSYSDNLQALVDDDSLMKTFWHNTELGKIAMIDSDNGIFDGLNEEDDDA